MFPNDDICNEIAAKRAARNIFKSFSSANDNQHNVGLGEEEVSRLMKKVYSIVDVGNRVLR